MIGRIAKPWPGSHYVSGAHPTARFHAAVQGITPGSLVEVRGPYHPNGGWTCGTSVEWHLDDARIPLNDVGFCEHHIQFEPQSAEIGVTAESNHVEVSK